MTQLNHLIKRNLSCIIASIILLVTLVAPSLNARQTTIFLAPGDQIMIRCRTELSGKIDVNRAIISCAPQATPMPTKTSVPTPTHNHTTPMPTRTAVPTPTHDHKDVGVCGEPMDRWHAPVINGCATGHEHGDPPPSWIKEAGYDVSFHGHFNTSPIEHTAKHAAMKGFSATFNGVDVYFRVHAASNVLDRMARYHSYEVWARDSKGGVSHWQGWYNTGDPVTDRASRASGDPGRRPLVLVVDQESWDKGIRCEQWYAATAEWSWDFGWTICNTTTIYYTGENSQPDLARWRLAPDRGLGTTRRLEAAWYLFRKHPTGKFYATQFGEIVSGPDDARCKGTTTSFGTTYQNVCLEQYIAPTVEQVSYPGNAVQKSFDAPGLKLPN